MTYLKAIVLAGVAAMLAIAAVPEVSAADLGVTGAKPVRAHHARARVVRDYDGTPVVERRVRLVQRAPDGAVLVSERIEMNSIQRAEPGRYLNGQPVLPQRPRTAIVVTRRF